MQFTPHQLKDKLLRGLDQDNNVVDMLGVCDVISILEKYPITKEALEATRIGKYINEMRKRTNNKDLAKRAKNLVRQWQNLVTGSPVEVNGGGDQIAPVGGSRTAPSGLPGHLKQAPGSKPASPVSRPSHLKQAPGSKPASPVSRPSIPANGKTSHSPKLPGHSRCSTPVTPTSVQSLSPKAFLKSQITGTHTHNHVGSKPASPALSSGSSRNSPGLPHIRSEPVLSQTNSPGNHSATAETLLKTNAANKKRRREPVDSGIAEKTLRMDNVNNDEGGGSVKLGLSRVGSTVNGLVRSSSADKLLDTPTSVHLPGTPASCGSGRRNAGLAVKIESTPDRFNLSRTPASSTRTPKVASTKELIAKLRDRGLNTNICPDKIEREKEEDTGVVPPEAKPRPRRKPGTIAPPAPDTPLSQTKSEMVHKFLQTQITPSPVDLDIGTPVKIESPVCSDSPAPFDNNNPDSVNTSLHSVGSSNHSYDATNMDWSGSPLDVASGGAKQQEEPVARGMENGPNEPNVITSDLWSLLPPLNLEEINWDDDSYEVPDRPDGSEFELTRLHSEQWAAVNGQYDVNEQWRDWTSCLSLPTYNGDLLHILPYVNIDDEC